MSRGGVPNLHQEISFNTRDADQGPCGQPLLKILGFRNYSGSTKEKHLVETTKVLLRCPFTNKLNISG